MIPVLRRARCTLAALSLLLLGFSAAALGAPPAGVTLDVFAAASLADVFGDLGRQFEKAHPGFAVRFNLAGSQQLATQIEQGAPADVFASADQAWMDHVKEHSLLAGEAAVFARNHLVVVVPRTNPARIERLQDLARRGVKMVIGADAVPVGRYGRQALQNLSAASGFERDYATRVLGNVVSEEENVKSVLAKVQLGEADAGIVYVSDVSPALARYVRTLEIPADANVLATYPIAVVQGSRQPDAARDFVALVLSADGQSALRRHGLIPVAGDTK